MRFVLASLVVLIASPMSFAEKWSWTPTSSWAWCSEPKPEPKVVKPTVKPVKLSVSGWHFPRAGEISDPGHHWHVCDCGRVCQHGDEHHGDVAAHTCVCGRLNFEKTPGTPIYCPDGNCPRK